MQLTSGAATVTRADGSVATLQDGDAVFLGDVVETSGGGSAALTPADNTEFAIG